MRRKDRERDEEFAIGVIDSAPYGVAAFTDENGDPYAIPLSLVRIGKELYFHSAKAGTKNEIFKTEPRACVTFADNVIPATDAFTTGYDSAIVKGRLCEVTDDEEKVMALKKLSEHFCPGHMAKFGEAIEMSLGRTAVFKISMEEITGKQKKL